MPMSSPPQVRCGHCGRDNAADAAFCGGCGAAIVARACARCGRGARHEVQGEGVVGEQPLIAPGASFDYVSGCPLATPSGAMFGRYGMVGEDGGRFDVAIPRFPLIGPATAR